MRHAAADPAHASQASVVALQRVFGNAAVADLIGVQADKGKKTPRPKMTHVAEATAPAGAGQGRKVVGVGEEVTFTGNQAGDWAASAGKKLTEKGSEAFAWTAPDRAASPTITFTAGGRKASAKLKVVEPRSITARKDGETTISPATRAGAGMLLTFRYRPLTVSFGNVQIGEVSGPPTKISGYYKEHYTAGDLHHDSGDHFTTVGEDNWDQAQDTAETTDPFTPYKPGYFQWVVPNRFKTVTESGDGKVFAHVTQSFEMLNRKGTIEVGKAGKSVKRTPAAIPKAKKREEPAEKKK